MNQKQLLLHIPHSSIYIPKEFTKSYLINNLVYQKKEISDLYTNDLYSSIPHIYKEVFKYNRFFIDVERLEDNLEEMAKIGRGWYYEMDNNNEPLRTLDNKEKLYPIFKNYHEKLKKKILNYLKSQPITIIDCHSFSNDNVWFNKKTKKPEICIGYDNNVDFDIVEQLSYIFKDFNIDFNNPYSGSYYPLNVKNSLLKSVMIEINKSLYMNEKTFEIKSFEFNQLKKLLSSLKTS